MLRSAKTLAGFLWGSCILSAVSALADQPESRTAQSPAKTAITQAPAGLTPRMSGVPILADGMRGARQVGTQVWDGGNLYTLPEVKSGSILCSRAGSKKSKSAELRIPEGHRFATVANGVAFTYARTKDGWALFEGHKFQGWSSLGTIADPQLMVADIRPLTENRLLVARVAVPFVSSDKASFLGIFKKDAAGVFRFESCVDDGLSLFDTKLRARNPKGPAVNWVAPEKQVVYVDFASIRFVDASDAILLVLPKSGWVLAFNAENGRTLGASRLFPSMDSREHREKVKEVAILGWRPTSDGRLLLASRSEDAVLHARDIFQDVGRLNGLDSDAYSKAMESYFVRSLEAFPDIWWWEFDPQSRHFTRTTAPQSVPSRLDRPATLRTFGFWMDARGLPTTTQPVADSR